MNITFDRVSFSYKKEEKPILKELSFQVKKGDRIALKGSSGSGKTTIFRLLLGFEQPDEGQIVINDQNLNEKTVNDLRAHTSWLPQDLNLGEGKTSEVFYYPFDFKANSDQKPSEETALETLVSLGLPEKVWNDKFEDLSTGQRQRIGIALCHLLKKPIVLLDEPTSALDDTSKDLVKKLLFADKEDIIISTSHDPWWIDQCDRVINLDG